MGSQLFAHFHRTVCKVGSGFKPERIVKHWPSLQMKWRPNYALNHYGLSRTLTTTSCKFREVLLPGNLVQSPQPDLHLPENAKLHEVILEKCDQFGDKSAISDVATGKTYTYRQLKDKSICVASALSRKGYKKGDVLLMVSTNQMDFTVTMLAASLLGCWFSAANPSYVAEELARQINHSECKAVFSITPLLPVVEAALKMNNYSNSVKECFVFGEAPGWMPFKSLLDDDGKSCPDVSMNAKEDVYVLPYSSGTTGLPKGVMLTHHNVVSNLLQVDKYNSIEENDNVLCLLPLYHAYAQLVTQFGCLYVGGHMINLTHFEPQSFLQCLQDHKITYANLVPPLIIFMTKHPMIDEFDLSNLSCVTSAAAPLGRELSEDFNKRFPKIKLVQGYGLTEASPGINFDNEQNIGSVGPLVPNTLAKIIDLKTGETLGPGQQGELCTKGPQMMKGYFKNPEATREMLHEDGWMHTGDVAYYDEKGLFYITERLKELIKYKGFQVAPAELEAVLLGHPEIADACVIGIPDDSAGEVPKAFVVKKLDSNLTEKDVAKFIEGQLSHTKWLRGGVEFMQEIPKNPSGKILRRLLRK